MYLPSLALSSRAKSHAPDPVLFLVDGVFLLPSVLPKVGAVCVKTDSRPPGMLLTQVLLEFLSLRDAQRPISHVVLMWAETYNSSSNARLA